MSTLKLSMALLILAVLAFSQSGCSLLNSQTGPSSAPAVTGQAANGMYMVDVVPMVGKQESFKGQIRDNMTVQNALEESGALKRIRNADVTLFRLVRGSGRSLKLPVTLQAGKKMVKFEEDYAVHPGDRIVVESKSSTGLDKVLNALMPQNK